VQLFGSGTTGREEEKARIYAREVRMLWSIGEVGSNQKDCGTLGLETKLLGGEATLLALNRSRVNEFLAHARNECNGNGCRGINQLGWETDIIEGHGRGLKTNWRWWRTGSRRVGLGGYRDWRSRWTIAGTKENAMR